jgi:hypothetical protein
MPRFVILHHELPAQHALATGRATHWDLMLEWGDVLRTWALPAPPAYGQTCQAEQLADHRAAYLDYEGPVSGNRGQVTRWDTGHYEVQQQDDTTLRLTLQGQRLATTLALKKQVLKEGDAPQAADGRYFWEVSLGSEPTRG